LQLIRQVVIVMPIRALIILAITVALPVGIRVNSACAQDPAVVNSNTIRVRFENDRVRVLEAILPAGVKEQVHSHPAYVIYVLAGGRYRNYAADGKISEGTFQTGDVIYRDPLTHAAENIGDKPMHFILVELKSEGGSSTSGRP
jgi:quercetin dioxygenase-like cupin family protein